MNNIRTSLPPSIIYIMQSI